MLVKLPVNKDLRQRAKELRKNSTLSEVLFWNRVKRKQFLGLDFDRQKIIGNYIVDFYCSKLELAIEIDGNSHDEKKFEYDIKREKYLKSLGLKIIRINDLEIKKNMENVLKFIEANINTTPPLLCLPQSGKHNSAGVVYSRKRRTNMSKRIGILTTGGDCSGLNSVIFRLITAGIARGHQMVGIVDGTDGLSGKEPQTLNFTPGPNNYPPAQPTLARLSGSLLRNGRPGALNYRTAKGGDFQKAVKKSIEKLKLDAVVLLGGNGSISLANANPEVYASTQLVCIPKTIDMDIPMTDRTIGFETAVGELVKYCDQLLLTARSHHRWFVVQTMGRDCGFLCLHGGIAASASAILIPEIKWKMDALIKFIKKQPIDYGLIFASEGCRIRGRSGRIADIIVRDLSAAGVSARAEFPEHLQRSGDTTASDRILAASFAEAALAAIENNETFVMTAKRGNEIKTVALAEVIAAGVPMPDPNIPSMSISNEYVSPSDPLIKVAANLGVFVS